MSLLRTAIVAIGLQSCALFGADFFPLHEGNRWTYREPATGQTLSVSVGQPATIAGHVYYDLIGYTDTDLQVRIEETYGALVYWDGVRNQEMLLTSFEQFEGGHWLAPFRPCPEQDGQGQLKLGNHDGPAGPIAGVLEIQYRAIGCADAGALQEQYAEHLGMLRRVVTTIAGPRTFDLIAARVGNITIDAAPQASFSVSLGPTTGAGPVLATFRLHVNSKLPLTLPFSSGQEYDFALKDSAGGTLWRWSASRTFLQALHQRIVADEWSAIVEIPWPTTSGGVLQPGDYTVEAVVTNANSLPFAATVPVTIATASTSAGIVLP
jgi:intracellular proteinase inhibitor BsuPI